MPSLKQSKGIDSMVLLFHFILRLVLEKSLCQDGIFYLHLGVIRTANMCESFFTSVLVQIRVKKSSLKTLNTDGLIKQITPDDVFSLSNKCLL